MGKACPNFIPAQVTGRIGRLSSNRYNGNPQVAVRRSRLSVFSANTMWNIWGMQTAPAKNTTSSVRAVLSRRECSMALLTCGLSASQRSTSPKLPNTP